MPTVITTINASDALEPTSRTNINNNFASLNANKLEVGNNLLDVVSKPSAINNILPSQTGNNGKFLTTNGTVASWGNSAGVPDASTIVKGITEISVTPVDPTTPIALGTNDVRCPQVDVSSITVDIVNALAGTGVPSGSNKFVTADTDALKELLANKDATVTLGASDTKYPTQKAVKTYVDNQIATRAASNPLGTWSGDIKANADGNGHQVTTDGFLVGYTDAVGGAPDITVYTDSNATPTTVRWYFSGTNGHTSFMIPVKKNDYYKVVLTSYTMTHMYFLPLGT